MKNTKKIEFKPLTPIDGNQSEAVNVRRRGDWMEVTGTPAAVCPKTPADRFLGADRRGSRTYYFMQRNGKDVIMSGYRQDGTFTAVQRTLFADGGSVTGFAVRGEFVVMSTSAGLRYLHFNGSGYDSLGGMVEMPEFAFGTIMSATISTDIAGITLKGSYPQWKGTLAASDRSGVERAFRSAISELQTVASAGGCCLQPVVLRVALRLWDDSLLWSGAAACVGHAWQPETLTDATPGAVSTIDGTTLSATMWHSDTGSHLSKPLKSMPPKRPPTSPQCASAASRARPVRKPTICECGQRMTPPHSSANQPRHRKCVLWHLSPTRKHYRKAQW